MSAGGRFATSIACAGAALLLSAPVAGAAARFASPTGTTANLACPVTAPCDIVTAVEGSSKGDDITIEPGTYGPISATLYDKSVTLTIHGQAGAPRPVVITSGVGAAIILAGPNSSLSDVEFDVPTASATGVEGFGAGVSIDRVISHVLGASSYACTAFGTVTITNSVCVADAVSSYAFWATNGASPTLRNDTLEAPGGSGATGGVAVWADATSMRTCRSR